MSLEVNPPVVASGARKRPRNEDNWVANKVKKARNLGKEYVSRMSGNLVKARQIGADCGCTNCCFDKVGIENIKQIFKQYYDIGCYNIQCAYIQSHTTENAVVRHRTHDITKQYKCSRSYHVEVNGVKISVCQKAFASFLGTDERALRRASEKRTSAGVLIPDMRGKHDNHSRYV